MLLEELSNQSPMPDAIYNAAGGIADVFMAYAEERKEEQNKRFEEGSKLRSAYIAAKNELATRYYYMEMLSGGFIPMVGMWIGGIFYKTTKSTPNIMK